MEKEINSGCDADAVVSLKWNCHHGGCLTQIFSLQFKLAKVCVDQLWVPKISGSRKQTIDE